MTNSLHSNPISANSTLTVDLSVVVPLLNEADSLVELHQRIVSAARSAGLSYEILFVDDGSRDNSYEIIRGLHRQDNNVRAIRFRSNYGKSAALSAGFKEVRGRYVITMDADLQDDPAEIPVLIAKLEEGYDLISGWKKVRHDPITKTWPSMLFNKVTAVMTGIPIHDFNCGLKAYRREVTQDIPVYGELHRYLPALAKWQGYRISEVAVQHHPRKHGSSKFGLSRFYRGFFDLLTVIFITRYLKRPMHLFGAIGTVSFAAGLGVCLHLTWLWWQGFAIGQRPLLLLGALLLIVGVQFFSIGLIGEMITNLKSDHDTYAIKERLGTDSQTS